MTYTPYGDMRVALHLLRDAMYDRKDAANPLHFYRLAAQLRQLADRADKLAAIYDTPTPDQ